MGYASLRRANLNSSKMPYNTLMMGLKLVPMRKELGT